MKSLEAVLDSVSKECTKCVHQIYARAEVALKRAPAERRALFYRSPRPPRDAPGQAAHGAGTLPAQARPEARLGFWYVLKVFNIISMYGMFCMSFDSVLMLAFEFAL